MGPLRAGVNLDVIGSSTTEAYGGRGGDARRIARDLNVRYVLRGAIQREGDRVSALLQDGGTGASLWSNRWDRPSGDIFAVQNEVSDGVISTLGGRGLLTSLAAVAARRKGPSDLEGYDLFALGLADFYKGGQEGFTESIKFFDAAIAKDPQFGFAYVKKGWMIFHYALSANGDLDEAANELERLARKAIEIDPYDAEGHVALGDKLVWWGDFAQGAVEVERAIELNPSSADIMAMSAGAMSYLGRPEQGAALCDKAYRLNSAPPIWYPGLCFENYFFTKRYRESVEATKRYEAWVRPPQIGFDRSSSARPRKSRRERPVTPRRPSRNGSKNIPRPSRSRCTSATTLPILASRRPTSSPPPCERPARRCASPTRSSPTSQSSST
jgi:tetratricopeptide (TPR) repeat protein